MTKLYKVVLISCNNNAWGAAGDTKETTIPANNWTHAAGNAQALCPSGWEIKSIDHTGLLFTRLDKPKSIDLTPGQKVKVYDRYRFAIAVNGRVLDTNENGVSVILDSTNNPAYPIGTVIWVHKQQVELLSDTTV